VTSLAGSDVLRENEFAQKYLLARKDELGHYKKVETFSEPVTPEQVQTYGPGRYVLRKGLPRFETVWTWTVQNVTRQDPDTAQLHKLDRQTKYLGIGLVGSFGTQALGFALSYLQVLEDRSSDGPRRDSIEIPTCSGILLYYLPHANSGHQ